MVAAVTAPVKKLARFLTATVLYLCKCCVAKKVEQRNSTTAQILPQAMPYCFCTPDTTLSPNALAELARAMQNETVQYGYFAMNFDDPHPLAALYSAATRINSILTHYGDSGIFARRTFFEAIGRFPEQEFMEDVEFLLRARAVAEPTLITNATVTTSARRFKKNGFLSQQLLNAYLIARYILGADVHELKRCYNSLER